MGKNKYRFKGHESFILREGWLNKGLYEVDVIRKFFQKIMEQMHLEWDRIWQRQSGTGSGQQSWLQILRKRVLCSLRLVS